MKLVILAAALIWPGAVEGPYGTDYGCNLYLEEGEEGLSDPPIGNRGPSVVVLPDGVLFEETAMCTFELDATGAGAASCAGEGREWEQRFELKPGFHGALIYEVEGERLSLSPCMLPAQ